jgi:hypothetical protein
MQPSAYTNNEIIKNQPLWTKLCVLLASGPDSYCKALGADFHFSTNRNAWFGLNIGPDSYCKVGLNPASMMEILDP